MQTKEPLRRSDVPPEKGPRDWIYRVRPGAGFRGQIISPAVWGVFTHWDGNRTRECFQDVKKCERCRNSEPSRWRAYLHVYNALQKDLQFLELTADATEELWRLAGKKESLRGYILEVKRKGAGIRGTLLVTVYPPPGDCESLPEARDPEETLRKLWSWTNYR